MATGDVSTEEEGLSKDVFCTALTRANPKVTEAQGNAWWDAYVEGMDQYGKASATFIRRSLRAQRRPQNSQK